MKFTNALGGCANCGALTSPCWRKGPEEAKHLCNACGSRYLVKGTLEGYKPGLKNRTGGKRSKSSKSKPFPGAFLPSRGDSPPKRMRLFKDPMEHHRRSHADKSIQVNTTELQRMEPFSRTLSAFDGSEEAYLDSPKSHFERIKLESGNVFSREEGMPDLKDSSDESTPEAEIITANGIVVSRRRARKPFRPQVSTW